MQKRLLTFVFLAFLVVTLRAQTSETASLKFPANGIISQEKFDEYLFRKFNGIGHFDVLEEAMEDPDAVLKLDLRNRALSEIPSEITQFTNLQVLDLSGNELTSLPSAIGSLKNLKTLKLSENQFTNVPYAVCKLKNLKELYLNGNKISKISNEINCLINLEKLFLQNNEIISLSKEIKNLKSLRYLYLYANKLSALPDEICELEKLQVFFIQNNQISIVPRCVDDLLYLRYFNASNQISVEILKNQLRKQKIQESYDHSVVSTGNHSNGNIGGEASSKSKYLTGEAESLVVNYPLWFKPITALEIPVWVLLYPIKLVQGVVSKKFRCRIRYNYVYRIDKQIARQSSRRKPNHKKIQYLYKNRGKILSRIKKRNCFCSGGGC